MRKVNSSLLSSLAAASLALFVGGSCASDTAATSIDAGALNTGPVSFTDDIVPIFARACSQTSCHGAGTGQLTLDKSDAAQNHAALVGVASIQLASMPRVTAGKPDESYLLYKVEGTQADLDARCVGGSCLTSMPQGGLLDADDLALLRRWVEEGANN